MQKDVKFQLEEAVEIPNWSKAYPEHKFTVFKCCFLSTKPNSHELDISAKVLKKCADTILGNFLVAKLECGDATTHKDSEIIYGYFPNEQEIEFVEDDDILKAYAYAVVSKRYSKEFNGIFEFDNIRNSSVEMTVETDEDDENIVLSFDLYGLTVLGKRVNGSCPDADIKMVRFSTDEADAYFAKSNIVDTLQKFVKERNKQMADKTYKVDKSKEAMSEKAWGEVDKTELRNKIMEASNRATLVKSVYMLVEDGWEDAPSEHLKYPVMCFEGDTLVYNRYGLASALAYAKQEGEDAVVSKVEKIYKKLDLDDVDGKEEKMAKEIEFAAVDINNMWGRLWNAIQGHWDYDIRGIYEEDNKKFAILTDRDFKLFRLDFSLTEDGLTIADDVIEVKQEFIETDNVKKFAEPENIDDYRRHDDDDNSDEHDDDDDHNDENEEEMSADEMMARISELEKAVEERDNIIMDKNAELDQLRQFKDEIDEKEKAKTVEGIMAEVKDFLDDESAKTFREEGMLCKLDDIDGWANKVKAASFEATKNKKTKKENLSIWGFAAPKTAPQQKSDSVWCRI